MLKPCYCDSGKIFEACCKPFLMDDVKAKTALELMRSRYSAYVLKKGQYLYDTCSSKLKNVDDIQSINHQKIHWLGLKVQSFSDNEVVFMAYYKEEDNIHVFKERSLFVIEDDAIVYDSGEMLPAQINRNEACPCGSGKKYKKCCA